MLYLVRTLSSLHNTCTTNVVILMVYRYRDNYIYLPHSGISYYCHINDVILMVYRYRDSYIYLPHSGISYYCHINDEFSLPFLLSDVLPRHNQLGLLLLLGITIKNIALHLFLATFC